MAQDITFEEFWKTEIENSLKGWISQKPRPRSSWLASVGEWKALRYGSAYTRDYPRSPFKCPDCGQSGEHACPKAPAALTSEESRIEGLRAARELERG
jgi:hypothetical protein